MRRCYQNICKGTAFFIKNKFLGTEGGEKWLDGFINFEFLIVKYEERTIMD
jgi:hypothetical protein